MTLERKIFAATYFFIALFAGSVAYFAFDPTPQLFPTMLLIIIFGWASGIGLGYYACLTRRDARV